jgi:ABC-2 type transport system permease protein
MKSLIIAGRVIRQIAGDKRTLAVMLVAPILIMTLLYFLLASSVTKVNIDIVDGDAGAAKSMEEYATVTEIETEDRAIDRLKDGTSDAYISGDRYVVEGTDAQISALAMRAFSAYAMQQKLEGLPPEAQNLADSFSEVIDVETYYGSDDFKQFDYIAPSLMGFIIFFLVFLLAGIAFLRERISGTLERVMATSLHRSQLVAGYFIGFGVFAVLQTVVIQAYLIYVLGIHTDTNFLLVLLINLCIAGTSLALGTLFSAFARNEFQLFQFIPLVVIPQVMFCGLFSLREAPAAMQWLSYIFPLTYGADALRAVMLRGLGFGDIWLDLVIMIGFIALFIMLNIRVLRKYRAI